MDIRAYHNVQLSTILLSFPDRKDEHKGKMPTKEPGQHQGIAVWAIAEYSFRKSKSKTKTKSDQAKAHCAQIAL